MSRRDNGLPAVNWTHLTDLAPPLADQVLGELRDAGIPAYATPATPTRDYLDGRSQPRPTDRVFVERDDATRAREVLEHVLPTLRAELEQERAATGGVGDVSTDDDVWAGIVAAYSAPAAEPVGRWSVAEDVDHGESSGRSTTTGGSVGDAADRADRADEIAGGPGEPAEGAASGSNAPSGFEDIRAELDALQAERAARFGPADDPIDHFVPPPPPPLPTVDVVTRTAWVALVGGPLFLIVGYLLGWGAGGLSGFLAVIAFVGGFVTLVFRMRSDPPDDDDNGAVV